MDRKPGARLWAICLVLGVIFPLSGSSLVSVEQKSGPAAFTPQNTVIVANEMDARFSQDFSTLLKHLRVEWIVLQEAELPESVRDKNLILLGRVEAVYSGALLDELLSADELEELRDTADEYVIIHQESPWQAGRSVVICSGSDLLSTRDAAEQAVRQLIAESAEAAFWFRSTYDSEWSGDPREFARHLQYEWPDEELPLSDLTMDVSAATPRQVSADQAAADVERLFYLLSHGYSGYTFFNPNGEFDHAKKTLLQAIPNQTSWSMRALSKLLQENLAFICDCHLSIAGERLAGHQDFWYDPRLEVVPGNHGYQFEAEGDTYTLRSINDQQPGSFLFPSLNREGEAIYRLGLLSKAEPMALQVQADSFAGERGFELKLRRSNFDYYSADVFSEDLLGGVPVVRVRSFSDIYSPELNQFVATGSKFRTEPVVVVDIRGNGGGNEHWPISWIQRLTGRRAEAIFIHSELESKTSLAGRANAFTYWDHNSSGQAMFHPEAVRYTRQAEAIENERRQAGWTAVRVPQLRMIENDTTVIVVSNAQVASAGEGLVLRISRLENVWVVGENTHGCLTFGNISLHQLPHSKIEIWMPINFGIFPDQEFREEVGLLPDLWIPAEQAVDNTVAAVRRGTITTNRPLSEAVLEQDFVSEASWVRRLQQNLRNGWLVLIFAAGGIVFAYFMRARPLVLFAVGTAWLLMSMYLLENRKDSSTGLSFLIAGLIFFAWGAVGLLRSRRKQPAV